MEEELIKVPRLRLAQLQSLTQSAVKIVQPHTEVETETNAVTTAFAPFKESMIKIDASSDKKELDQSRDTLISGLVQATKSEQKFPHEDDSVISVLKEFTDIVNKYGVKLAYLPYDEESAEADNLIDELKRLDLTLLDSTGLSRWIPVMEDANNAFKTRSDEFIGETVATDEIEAATELSLPLIKALNKLFLMLFSKAHSTQSEALIKAHNEMEKLVDSYR